jgi:hypothetical protein
LQQPAGWMYQSKQNLLQAPFKKGVLHCSAIQPDL